MAAILERIQRKIRRVASKDYVLYDNAILPPKPNRFCGGNFMNDEYFLTSAQKEAERLMTFFNLTKRTRILDVGCGQGRLPIGILSRIGEIEHYRGIDVNKKSIQWCQKHITKRHPTFQFIHLDIKNLRYNPKGNEIDYSYRLPLFDKEFDIIYLYSVFSHMTELDVEVYLKEFHRLLAPSGRLFVTAFIEEGVPDVSINPDNYKTDWNNEPLHCVRYSRSFFNSLLEGSNFSVERFDHATETDGQSAIYALTKEDR